MLPTPTQRTQIGINTQNRNITNTSQNNNCQQNTRRLRTMKSSTTESTSQAGSIHSEENESLDPENTCYIREVMENWSTVNLIHWKWAETKINKINKSHLGEIWLQNQTGKLTQHRLVNTGSPRSFISQTTVNWLTSNSDKTYKEKQ